MALGAHRVGLLGAAGSASVTYATFDTTNKSPRITLSNGNLTAAKTGVTVSTWGYVVSSIGKSTGKWFCEITIDSIGTYAGVGVCGATEAAEAATDDADGTAFWLAGENGVLYLSLNGDRYIDNSAASYGDSYTAGDVVGVALDADSATVTFYKNGVSQGAISPSGSWATGDTYYIGVGPQSDKTGTSKASTANFGASAFSYSVPVGYNPGWYE